MRLRPSLSARWEEKGETRRAKREVEEVMMDLSKDVRRRLDREVSMETRVADMTPVSSGKFYESLVTSETDRKEEREVCKRLQRRTSKQEPTDTSRNRQ